MTTKEALDNIVEYLRKGSDDAQKEIDLVNCEITKYGSNEELSSKLHYYAHERSIYFRAYMHAKSIYYDAKQCILNEWGR